MKTREEQIAEINNQLQIEGANIERCKECVITSRKNIDMLINAKIDLIMKRSVSDENK